LNSRQNSRGQAQGFKRHEDPFAERTAAQGTDYKVESVHRLIGASSRPNQPGKARIARNAAKGSEVRERWRSTWVLKNQSTASDSMVL
jgi:hypothetical protein